MTNSIPNLGGYSDGGTGRGPRKLGERDISQMIPQRCTVPFQNWGSKAKNMENKEDWTEGEGNSICKGPGVDPRDIKRNQVSRSQIGKERASDEQASFTLH